MTFSDPGKSERLELKKGIAALSLKIEEMDAVDETAKIEMGLLRQICADKAE